MSTTGVALRDLLDQVNDATKLLQRSKTVPEQVIGLIDSFETALGAADPYLTATLWPAALRAQKALRHDNIEQQRQDVRIASSSSARHCATANTEELVAINTALHYLGQGELPLPLMLVGAGLPSLPAQLADATSYAERLYDYRPVGLLDRPAAVDALTIPTRALGVDWDDTALAMSADVAGGYPYFLQAIGKHVWDNAINSPISADDVGWECATLAARSTTGFTAPGGNAPHLRNETCCALADQAGDGAATVSALASRMRKSRASDLSVARND